MTTADNSSPLFRQTTAVQKTGHNAGQMSLSLQSEHDSNLLENVVITDGGDNWAGHNDFLPSGVQQAAQVPVQTAASIPVEASGTSWNLQGLMNTINQLAASLNRPVAKSSIQPAFNATSSPIVSQKQAVSPAVQQASEEPEETNPKKLAEHSQYHSAPAVQSASAEPTIQQETPKKTTSTRLTRTLPVNSAGNSNVTSTASSKPKFTVITLNNTTGNKAVQSAASATRTSGTTRKFSVIQASNIKNTTSVNAASATTKFTGVASSSSSSGGTSPMDQAEAIQNSIDDIKKSYKDVKDDQGIIGGTANWTKNLFGAKNGTNKVNKDIKALEDAGDDLEELAQDADTDPTVAKEFQQKYKELTGYDYNPAQGLQQPTDDSLLMKNGYKRVEGFSKSQKTWTKNIAIGVGTIAAIAAPFTGGASLGLTGAILVSAGTAAVAGTATLATDDITADGNIDKSFDEYKDVAIESAISGATAPMGGAAGSKVAQIGVKEAVKETVLTAGKKVVTAEGRAAVKESIKSTSIKGMSQALKTSFKEGSSKVPRAVYTTTGKQRATAAATQFAVDGGLASFGTTYYETGDLKAAGVAGVTGAVVGGVMGGTGSIAATGVRRLRGQDTVYTTSLGGNYQATKGADSAMPEARQTVQSDAKGIRDELSSTAKLSDVADTDAQKFIRDNLSDAAWRKQVLANNGNPEEAYNAILKDLDASSLAGRVKTKVTKYLEPLKDAVTQMTQALLERAVKMQPEAQKILDDLFKTHPEMAAKESAAAAKKAADASQAQSDLIPKLIKVREDLKANPDASLQAKASEIESLLKSHGIKVPEAPKTSTSSKVESVTNVRKLKTANKTVFDSDTVTTTLNVLKNGLKTKNGPAATQIKQLEEKIANNETIKGKDLLTLHATLFNHGENNAATNLAAVLLEKGINVKNASTIGTKINHVRSLVGKTSDEGTFIPTKGKTDVVTSPAPAKSTPSSTTSATSSNTYKTLTTQEAKEFFDNSTTIASKIKNPTIKKVFEQAQASGKSLTDSHDINKFMDDWYGYLSRNGETKAAEEFQKGLKPFGFKPSAPVAKADLQAATSAAKTNSYNLKRGQGIVQKFMDKHPELKEAYDAQQAATKAFKDAADTSDAQVFKRAALRAKNQLSDKAGTKIDILLKSSKSLQEKQADLAGIQAKYLADDTEISLKANAYDTLNRATKGNTDNFDTLMADARVLLRTKASDTNENLKGLVDELPKNLDTVKPGAIRTAYNKGKSVVPHRQSKVEKPAGIDLDSMRKGSITKVGDMDDSFVSQLETITSRSDLKAFLKQNPIDDTVQKQAVFFKDFEKLDGASSKDIEKLLDDAASLNLIDDSTKNTINARIQSAAIDDARTDLKTAIQAHMDDLTSAKNTVEAYQKLEAATAKLQTSSAFKSKLNEGVQSLKNTNYKTQQAGFKDFYDQHSFRWAYSEYISAEELTKLLGADSATFNDVRDRLAVKVFHEISQNKPANESKATAAFKALKSKTQSDFQDLAAVRDFNTSMTNADGTLAAKSPEEFAQKLNEALTKARSGNPSPAVKKYVGDIEKQATKLGLNKGSLSELKQTQDDLLALTKSNIPGANHNWSTIDASIRTKIEDALKLNDPKTFQKEFADALAELKAAGKASNDAKYFAKQLENEAKRLKVLQDPTTTSTTSRPTVVIASTGDTGKKFSMPAWVNKGNLPFSTRQGLATVVPGFIGTKIGLSAHELNLLMEQMKNVNQSDLQQVAGGPVNGILGDQNGNPVTVQTQDGQAYYIDSTGQYLVDPNTNQAVAEVPAEIQQQLAATQEPNAATEQVAAGDDNSVVDPTGGSYWDSTNANGELVAADAGTGTTNTNYWDSTDASGAPDPEYYNETV